MSIVHIADGRLLSVSLSVDNVLFKLVIRAVAAGWQSWVAVMVDVVLLRMELRSGNVGWQWWLSFVMVDVLLLWVVSDGLFKLALLVSLMEVGLLIGVALLIRAFAGGWLLEGALMSVFVPRYIKDLSLLRCVWNVLKLTVVGDLELTELIDQSFTVSILAVVVELVTDAHDASTVLSAVYLGQRAAYFIEVQHVVLYII